MNKITVFKQTRNDAWEWFESRHSILYDDCDAPMVEGHSAWAIIRGYAIYAGGKYRGKSMHQLIMGLPEKGLHIHHINGNKLDNRRCNLEVLTPKDHRSRHKRFSVSELKNVGWII